MFTNRKVVKKNAKKNINDLECEEIKEKDKITRTDSWEEAKKKGKSNNTYTQSYRQNVEAEINKKTDGKADGKADGRKTETEKEKPKWEKNNKNKKDNRKIFYKDKKKEEERNKVSITKTNAHIYSDNEDGDDNDNCMIIKKKKTNKRFYNYINKLANKEMKKEERNNNKNDSLKNVSKDGIWNYSIKKKEAYLFNKTYNYNEKKNEEVTSYKDKYNDQDDTDSDNQKIEDDENESAKKLHEQNFHLSLKDEDEDINEMEQISLYEQFENYENYNFMQVEPNLEKKQDVIFLRDRDSVEKKETQNEEEQRQQQQEQQQNYNMFINEENDNGVYGKTIMVQFTDEKEENDEETKQMIEKIKIKKQILRKKKEMHNIFENEFKGDLSESVNSDTENNYNDKKNKLFLNTFDFKKTSLDDDFEIEDIYNYETLSEIKKRLLIKKNKNEEVKAAFNEFGRNTEYNTEVLCDSENDNIFYKENSQDEFLEKQKIEKIINKQIMKNAKEEQDFYKVNQIEGSEEIDEENDRDEEYARDEENAREKENAREEENASSEGDETGKLFSNRHDNYSFSENYDGAEKKHHLRKAGEYCTGDKDNITKLKEDIEKLDGQKEKLSRFRKIERDGIGNYNKKNEQLFEKIKKTYEDKMVCNLQLVKMKKYIYSLFNEYKKKQEKYNHDENTEEKNKEEYRRLTHLCKNRKNEVIICTIFLEFFNNIRNLVLEKLNLVDSALYVLNQMEKTFHLIYQHLKLYLYKEFYEKYKFAFTTNYIFHLKYYRKKKEKQKQQRLKKLEKNNVLVKNELLYAVLDLSEKIVEQVNNVELFNNIPLLYLFDGFSSNYSSDSSDSLESDRKNSDNVLCFNMFSPYHNNKEEDKKNKKEEDKKQQTRKRKYCQTLKMKQLKEKFLTEVNNLCNDVKTYFLNFKNVIKHFYLLKSYNEQMYKNWKCAKCFEEIFFFFVKWEILHWDPIFQFSVKKKQKKKRILDYCRKNSCNTQNVNDQEIQTERMGDFHSDSSSNYIQHEDACWKNESESEKSEDNSFSLVSSDNSSGISSDQESEDESDKGQVERNEGNKGEIDKGKRKKGKLKRCEMKKKEIKKKEGKNHEKWENNDKELFPLFQNIAFRSAEYRFRKRIFNNPSIKSFEWYKFIESLMVIYDTKNEKTILKQLYKKILNRRVYELIEIWNPFSLKQSASMFVIIKEFLIYNNFFNEVNKNSSTDVNVMSKGEKIMENSNNRDNKGEKKNKEADEANETNETEQTKKEKEMKKLIQKVKVKMNECESVILESCKHIDTLKKRSTFLMRCLKFFKSFKNILYLLKNNELSEIVKKIYYDFVLTNYVNSIKFHQFIFASIIDILLFLNLADKDFTKEVTTQLDEINGLK